MRFTAAWVGPDRDVAALILPHQSFEAEKETDETWRMAMPLGMATYLMRMVWFSLSGWVFTCLSIADEIAGSLRNGDIGPFHVG
ncbi:unnamed protein product [Brassica rapa]|uniref:Uncharacterized protein n=6 Tax=Brassiceae TaxID=981071 RepID=A0A3P5YSF2_BRACM|nr:unnamed protein product [Brassica napus]CAG7865790.1 unnamed protein product [Brassica rapa]VDC62838.1 unnamed protein product [Brassica rapa]